MMQQYLDMKEEYKDCILLYRVGDFYELFFEDAKTVSKEIGLTLTGKDYGQEERAPMCGVPFHALEAYLGKIVKCGHKVAICEQVEDPKLAKGLVKREVTRIVSPGTILDMENLDSGENNYIMLIVCSSDTYGLAVCDISTGDFLTTSISDARTLRDEIARLSPKEILYSEAMLMSEVDVQNLDFGGQIAVSMLDAGYFDESGCVDVIKRHFGIESVEGLGLQEKGIETLACGALLRYLTDLQKNDLKQIVRINIYQTGKYMLLDRFSRRNLELTESMREKDRRGTLLWVLDKTKTAMGARYLRGMIERPLIDKNEIIKRLDCVEELSLNAIDREELREYLDAIYDLERLLGRVSSMVATPRDLVALKNSVYVIPFIKRLLLGYNSELIKDICSEIDELTDVYDIIDRAIVDDPPLLVREGGMIKEGYSQDADLYRKAKLEGKQWLLDLEEREIEKTGIKKLKVKFNKVFGYYIEVSNSYKDSVPDYYIRKQTLTNGERYTTEELKKFEDIILSAEEKTNSLEYELFVEVRNMIAAQSTRIISTAKAVAYLDALISLSVVAARNNYVKPKINDKGIIDIKEGRHPVVEVMLDSKSFVPNDSYLDNDSNLVSIITGPNMAGKSTYMRQVALITLMAQIGSFVPATSADISVVDRIFTRVGASDDLAQGQSTFMLEMIEVANILRNATPRSLLILDEIGRGTATFDGLSIAWAVVEYIANPKMIGAKTLFATHYHELTELEGMIKGVKNYCVAVKENGEDIVFLRKIIRGGADKSYGIQVARLAGVPLTVLNRANEIVAELSKMDITLNMSDNPIISSPVEYEQMSFFDTFSNDEIIEELGNLNLTNITPLEALNKLYEFQNKINNRWKN
ncbi:MAG: DNA mismatch repair protein MutS [Lachnospiraceae bacterium]|nr:DNA mismatch repair protein MutS [Lachnospiraceae bacterium]